MPSSASLLAHGLKVLINEELQYLSMRLLSDRAVQTRPTGAEATNAVDGLPTEVVDADLGTHRFPYGLVDAAPRNTAMHSCGAKDHHVLAPLD